MREITYEPREEAVVESFSVHYDDGTSKEVVNGLMVDMDSEEKMTAYLTNVDEHKLVNAAVSILELCRRFGLLWNVTERVRQGGLERAVEDMEVVVDEEPV